MIKCDLCGYQFDPNDLEKHCRNCWRSDCGLVCCPNCGYTFPPESKVVKFFQKLLKKRNPNDTGKKR